MDFLWLYITDIKAAGAGTGITFLAKEASILVLFILIQTFAKNFAGNVEYGRTDFGKTSVYRSQQASRQDKPFELPALYRTAHEALELMMDHRFHSGSVCTVAQLRTPLLLKNLEERRDLIAKEIQELSAYDKEKDTQYCETLYHYLTCCRSLKKTCDALFTHRNTVLYRIRRIQDDFHIPVDDPAAHADLLLGVSLLLFGEKGPDFFLRTINKNNRKEQLL